MAENEAEFQKWEEEFFRNMSISLEAHTEGDKICYPLADMQDVVIQEALPIIHDDSFDINRREGSITVVSQGSSAGRGRTIYMKSQFKIERISNFIHDFTVLPLCATTDTKLELGPWGRVDPVDDHYTPDIVKTIGDCTYVIEFTTNQAGTVEALKRAVDVKKKKYFRMLEKRLPLLPPNHKVGLFIMAIGVTGIFHNIPNLNQTIVDEIVYRYRMAIALAPQLEVHGFTVRQMSEEFTTRQKKVKSILESMQHKFGPLTEDDPWNPFTEEFYNKSISKTTSFEGEKLKEYIDQAILDSTKSYINDYKLEEIKEEVIKYNKDVLKKSVGGMDDVVSVDSSSVTEKLLRECKILREKFEHECSDTESRRRSNKAICQVPFLIPKAKLYDVNLSNPVTGDIHPSLERARMFLDEVDGNPIIKLWSEAIFKVKMGEVRRQDSDVKMEEEEVEDIYRSNLIDKLKGMGIGLNLEPLDEEEHEAKKRRGAADMRKKLDNLEKMAEHLSTAEKKRNAKIQKLLAAKRNLYLKTGTNTDEEVEEFLKLQKEIDESSEGGGKLKKDYHRVRIPVLDDEDRLNLALVGLHAKEFKDDPIVKNHLMESRKPLLFDTKTDDIDEFLNDHVDYMSTEWDEERLGSNHYPYELLTESARFHNQSTIEGVNLVKKFSRTSLGRFTSLVSDIAVELSISLKQHCAKDEMILKKLAHYNVFMLISPTRSDSHIFYSLMFLEDDLLGCHKQVPCFKELIQLTDVSTTEQLLITPFVSTNKSKLTNLVTLESKVAATFFYFCEFYEYAPQSNPICNIMKPSEDDPISERMAYEVYRMTMFSMLMMIHDKTPAEEAMTLSRYIFMEGLVSYPEYPKPHKMIEKFNQKQRSRLELYVQKKLLLSCEEIITNRFYSTRQPVGEMERMELGSGPTTSQFIDIENTDFDKTYVNMFNPITGEKLTSPMQMISIWYLGYFKNKEEAPESNSINQMFQKILSFEDIFEHRYEYVSTKDPPPTDCRKHEFSPTVVKMLTDFAMKTLERQLGKNFKDNIESEILGGLASISLESMATLKATSNFGPKWYNHDPKRVYHRGKVIEKIVEEVKEGESIDLIDILLRNLDKVEDNGCIHIDIFRKQQHGGLREIYVLEFPARVVQLAVETISRSICKFFQGETMTHPRNKYLLPGKHRYRSNEMFQKTEYITLCTNDDAAKWNQGHFTTKFAIMLLRMTPHYMHPLIFRVLKLWMRKRIMIPGELLEIFTKLNESDLADEIANKMKEAFMGRQGQTWMKKGTTYIETKTGMMQGILHYTSSLFHVIYQNWLEHTAEAWVKVLFREDVERKCVVTTMESSDDSAIILSLPAHSFEATSRSLSLASRLFRFKAKMGIYLGIYDSVKSTKNTLDMLEFNSEFFFGANLFRPSIRWVAASCSITEQESFVGRQEEMSNLVTSCLEGGCCLLTTFVVNVSQGLLHYRLLGSSATPLFYKFRLDLVECPDPSNGFFLVDNIFLAGMVGFKYNLWRATNSTSLSLKLAFLLRSTGNVDDYVDDEGVQIRKAFSLETSEAGNLVNSTVVTYGDRKKARRLINDLGLPEDWREVNEQYPEIYFRRPVTTQETLRKLAIKATTPGVTQSIAKSNSVPRIISSSVYILTQNIVSLTSIWNEGVFTSISKFRLLELVLRDKINFNSNAGNGRQELTEEQMKALFPYHEDYTEIHEKTTNRTSIVGAPYKRPRSKKRTDIAITTRTGSEDYNLEKICIWRWFPALDHLPMSERVKEDLWNDYKSSFSFLRDTIEDTLACSVFISYQQLQNFLARCDRKQRVVHLTAAPITAFSGTSALDAVITQDFFPGMTLSYRKPKLEHTDSEEDMRTSGLKMKENLHLITMLAQSPRRDRVKLMTEILAQETGLSVTPSSSKNRKAYEIARKVAIYLREREALDISTGDLKDKAASFRKVKSDVVETVKNLNIGAIGVFSSPQRVKMLTIDGKKEPRYVGPGSWSGSIGSVSVLLDFYGCEPSQDRPYQNVLTRVVCSSVHNIEDTLKTIQGLCMDFKIMNVTIPPGLPLYRRWNSMAPGNPRELSPISFVLNFKQHFTIKKDNYCTLVIDEDYKYNWNSENIISIELEFNKEYIKVKTVHDRNVVKRMYDPQKVLLENEQIDRLKQRIDSLRYARSAKDLSKKGKAMEELDALLEHRRETEKLTVTRVQLGASVITPTIEKHNYNHIAAIKKIQAGRFMESFLFWKPMSPKVDISNEVQKILDKNVGTDSDNDPIRIFIRERFLEAAARKSLLTYSFLLTYDVDIRTRQQAERNVQELMAGTTYVDIQQRAVGILSTEAVKELVGSSNLVPSTISDEVDEKADLIVEEIIENERRRLQMEVEQATVSARSSWYQVSRINAEDELQKYNDNLEERKRTLKEETAHQLMNELRMQRLEDAFATVFVEPGETDNMMIQMGIETNTFGEVTTKKVDSGKIMKVHPMFDRCLTEMIHIVGFEAARSLLKDKLYTEVTRKWVPGISWILLAEEEEFRDINEDVAGDEEDDEIEDIDVDAELGEIEVFE